MERILVISYDLSGPETRSSYEKLIKEIKSLGSHTKPLKSYWLVRTTQDCISVRDNLIQYLDTNDKILIIDYTNQIYAGSSLQSDAGQRIKTNM